MRVRFPLGVAVLTYKRAVRNWVNNGGVVLTSESIFPSRRSQLGSRGWLTSNRRLTGRNPLRLTVIFKPALGVPLLTGCSLLQDCDRLQRVVTQ